MSGGFQLDEARERRIGISEAVYCASKTPAQVAAVLDHADTRVTPMLLTRLSPETFAALPPRRQMTLNYDPVSRTAILGRLRPVAGPAEVSVVTAGTSDVPVAQEVLRTLRFEGIAAEAVVDVGVAGLWRLMARIEELRNRRVVIVVAGMDAALPSVVGGLVPGLVIAVPSSVGYGVAEGGHAALNAALSSCAPGIAVVNIDNGYGAACIAVRALGGRSGRSLPWSDVAS
jgi:NCAIR mutase (PurE)-related protein